MGASILNNRRNVMTQLLQKNVFGCDYTFQLPCITKEPSGSTLYIQYMVVFFHAAHRILYEYGHFLTAPLYFFPAITLPVFSGLYFAGLYFAAFYFSLPSLRIPLCRNRFADSGIQAGYFTPSLLLFAALHSHTTRFLRWQ